MQFREFENVAALETAATNLLAGVFRAPRPEGGDYAVMLTGGRTPRRLYERLAADPAPAAAGLHLFISDERHVLPESTAYNFTILRPLVCALSLPASRALHVDTYKPIEDAARAYEAALANLLALAPVTLGVLGLGADGHLASLFETDDLRQAEGRLAIAVRRPEPPHRVSVTPDVIRRTQRLVFIVAGAKKADVVARLRREPESLIAGRVTAGMQNVDVWFSTRAEEVLA
jgi:6-phosphogluconolactonase